MTDKNPHNSGFFTLVVIIITCYFVIPSFEDKVDSFFDETFSSSNEADHCDVAADWWFADAEQHSLNGNYTKASSGYTAYDYYTERGEDGESCSTWEDDKSTWE